MQNIQQIINTAVKSAANAQVQNGQLLQFDTFLALHVKQIFSTAVSLGSAAMICSQK